MNRRSIIVGVLVAMFVAGGMLARMPAVAAQAPTNVATPRTSGTETPHEARARAYRLLAESVGHSQAGRFREAAALLRESYSIYPDPMILVDLARSLEAAGDRAEAVEVYLSLLDAGTGLDAPRRTEIEARVDALSRELEAEAARHAHAAGSTPTPDAHPAPVTAREPSASGSSAPRSPRVRRAPRSTARPAASDRT